MKQSMEQNYMSRKK